MNNDATIIISTCDKFSDLWEANVKLLNENWPDREFRTIFVTDKETEKKFDNVEFFIAGAELDVPARLIKALNSINSKYIIFLLDDYFLTEKINNNMIKVLLNKMKELNIDFLTFHKKRVQHIELSKDPKIEKLIFSQDDNYVLDLYQSMWNTEYFKKMFTHDMSIWEFEVSLSKTALSINSNICETRQEYFPICDVVRKGYFLPERKKMLKDLGLLGRNRKLLPFYKMIKLNLMDVIKKLPKPVWKSIKNISKLFGFKYYS